ncbi:hypothetical protein [Streptomyces sp. NPDC051211]|uniref:hypothetical protein n=1 Tax=Streptomyces sp. NPDC051211 TaxID=3154643 RepID=UPI00344D42AA
MYVRTARVTTAALTTSILLTACGGGPADPSAPPTPAKAVLIEADLPEGWTASTSPTQNGSSPADKPECQVLVDLTEAGRPAQLEGGAAVASFANAAGASYETSVFELGEAGAAGFLKDVENAVRACGAYSVTAEADGGAEPPLPSRAQPLAAPSAGDGSYGFSVDAALDSDMSRHVNVVLVRRGGLIATSGSSSVGDRPDAKGFEAFTSLVVKKLTAQAP